MRSQRITIYMTPEFRQDIDIFCHEFDIKRSNVAKMAIKYFKEKVTKVRKNSDLAKVILNSRYGFSFAGVKNSRKIEVSMSKEDLEDLYFLQKIFDLDTSKLIRFCISDYLNHVKKSIIWR